MPDKVFTVKEANPPDKVFATQTNYGLDFGDRELVFDGPQGIGVFTAWINKAKQQGKDLTIKCNRITFRNRTGGGQ